jgi:DNA-binding transcriptional MerR regulator
MKSWKVGQLARSTGLSVRTLHHYDDIGLLSPSHRTESGHRLYAEGDVVRLQQIVSLRSLGLPLEEIRTMLDRRGVSLAQVLTLHAARLREQIQMQQRLVARLDAVATRLRSDETVSAEELIQTMEAMKMFEKYYTPEQMAELSARRETVGEERIQQVQAEWPVLIAEVQAEMDRGTDPADPRVRELARRWQGLVNEFTGGNPGIAKAVQSMYEQEDEIHGMKTAHMRPMMEYVGKAMAAAQREG